MRDRIATDIDAEAMAATVTILAGDPLPAGSLIVALREAGVTAGIHDTRVRELDEQLEQPNFTCTAEIVANGSPPTAGLDGRIDWNVATTTTPGTRRADGTIDYRERHSVHNVKAGTILATIRPPTQGQAGTDVRGEPLPAAPGADATPELGPGAHREGTQILATRDGVVCRVGDASVDVTELHQIPRGIDYDTGNASVDGSLIVDGSVAPGFCVQATRDVVIHGSLESARAVAEGNLIVDDGIAGTCPPGTFAAGDVSFRFANGAVISAGERILVGDHCVNADLRARRIECTSGKGRIIGGRAAAENSIHLGEAGTDSEVETVLIVARADAELARLRQVKRQADRSRRMGAKRQRNGEGRGGKGGKGGRQTVGLATETQREQRALRKRERELLTDAEILAADGLHIGVELRFGWRSLQLDQTVGPSRFVFDSARNQIVRKELER